MEKLIQYINILTKDGKSLLFRNYGSSEVDRDLLAGFLSAFSGFMKEISQSDIKSTATEDFKYFYRGVHGTIFDDYKGQWIVIKNQKVIAHGFDSKKVMEEVEDYNIIALIPNDIF